MRPLDRCFLKLDIALKIDRAFLRDTPRDKNAAAITCAIANITMKRNRKAIA
jgi:EAL domain-containing protein (putative c-di-GMP-specific phosphodiesterase class I)